MTQQPSLFRKKPVAVSAAQWHVNGDHPLDYSKTHDGLENGELRQFSPEERRANGWEGDIVRYYRHPDDSGTRACQHCGKTMHVHGWIDTKEGGHIVCPGDWIITGVQGEHYPCKPDIFAATYEPVGTPPASAQPERDWELTCDHCNGDGFVYVERQVAERKSDVQEFKEDCEECEGRGFTIAFEDIPGIAEYVRKSRPVASAQDDAKDERQAFEAWAHSEWGPHAPSLLHRDAEGDYIRVNTEWTAWQAARASVAAPAAGDARAWQGLTDSERNGYVGELVDYGTEFVAPLYSVVESIEKRLRDKNAASQQQEG